ncbi:MAG: ABC transporter permease, partial [Rectinemataceae bacterium]
VLGDQAYTKYPASFAYFGQGYLGKSLVPFELLVFLVAAVFCGIILNKTAARVSGVPVDKVRMIAFAASGLAAGIAAVMLTSRIGSTRPNIASGWDTDVITIVVLGGIAITGGKGNIAGVIISNFLLGYMKFGMGVLNVPGKVMNIITGVLLVVAILLPKFTDGLRASLRAGRAKSGARSGAKQ